MAWHAIKLVTLDATNTCFRITGSVGYYYAKVAQEFGQSLNISQVDSAFSTVYENISTKFPNFGIGSGISCKDWWLKVVTGTLTSVGVSSEVPLEKLRGIGERLYTDFGGPKYWEVYPDVHETLRQLKEAGVSLGVISNFDERLEEILSGLELAHYFDFVLCSYKVQWMKPDPRIFKLALKRGRVTADQALHIGDNYELDYLAAKEAGMNSLLLDRNRRMVGEKNRCVIGSLTVVWETLQAH